MDRTAQERKRDMKGRFAPGDKPPTSPGRAPKDPILKTRCRDMTTAALDRLEDIILHGKDGDAINAVEIVLAYGYGKPEGMSKLEISGKDGKDLVITWERKG